MTKWGSPVSGYLTHPFGGPRFCEVESRTIKREHEGRREDTASGVGQGRSGGRGGAGVRESGDGPWRPRRRCSRGGKRRSWNIGCRASVHHRLEHAGEIESGEGELERQGRGAEGPVKSRDGEERHSQRTGRTHAHDGRSRRSKGDGGTSRRREGTDFSSCDTCRRRAGSCASSRSGRSRRCSPPRATTWCAGAGVRAG